MIICLIFLGKVPSYTRYCVQQIRDWSSLPLYFITDDIEYSRDLLFDYEITYIHPDELQGGLITELEKLRDLFIISNGLVGREQLFYYSTLRLFLLENFMRKYNFNNVFHLEVDNLIYNDPENFMEFFNKKGLSYMYHNNQAASAAIFYARDYESLNHLNKETLTYINKDIWNGEMLFLGIYADKYPENVYILPHTSPKNTPIPRISENFDNFKTWVFDPQSYGFWLTGIDPIHSRGILEYRYNTFCPVNSTSFKYEWLVDEKGRKYPTVYLDNSQCKIFNLHVHSKDLKPHMSYKFKIPSNKELMNVTNSRLILKYANRTQNIYDDKVYVKTTQDYEEHLQQIIKCKYALCNTLEDIYECIYLGVIPIVQNSPLVQSLKDTIKMVITNDINYINLPIYLPTKREDIYIAKLQEESTVQDISSRIYQTIKEDEIISGETFQLMKGVVTFIKREIEVFRDPMPKDIIKAYFEDFDACVSLLKNSKIIQTYTYILPDFITYILPNLTHNFILICHNCDFGIDAKFIPLLEDNRIIHMFSQNTLINHPKLTPIPIGIANSKYDHGKKDILYRAMSTPKNRINKIYVNVDPGTNINHRVPIMAKMRANPLAVFANRSSYYDYLIEMKKYKWVCSPKGNGADCHRTWEALYLGCIPLVDNIVNFHELSKDLPMILIDDWSNITLEFLEKETSKLKFNYEMLNFNYWKDKIEKSLL
jgi:hypothetical protein